MNLRGFCLTLRLSSVSLCACAGPSYEADKTPSKDAAKALPAEPSTGIDVQSSVIEYDAKTAQAVGADVGGIVFQQPVGKMLIPQAMAEVYSGSTLNLKHSGSVVNYD